jgi:hypothetical protein
MKKRKEMIMGLFKKTDKAQPAIEVNEDGEFVAFVKGKK